MAQTTVNLQKMKSVASECENIFSTMSNNKKKLDELMAGVPKIWAGEGAQGYVKAYQQHSQDFVMLAESIRNCAATLNSIVNTYAKADSAAAEAIKSILAKG
ncbi:MAG: WXG100 family type VII secretion target [Deltaproteobacteria bacterium]|jgi:WXG100 family type VII secretion target|nr:WXG100 family type VII secretion target [Deltaproteobacteria bacterium]